MTGDLDGIVLHFAEFVVNVLNEYSTLLKQFLYYFNTFFLPPYSIKWTVKLHVFGQILV